MQSFIDVDLKSVDDFDASGLKVKCILKCAEWMRALREFPLNEVFNSKHSFNLFVWYRVITIVIFVLFNV